MQRSAVLHSASLCPLTGSAFLQTDIVNLLGPSGENPAGHSTGKEPNLDAESAASDNDGFGAFRPSTSFNDLTTLLPPEKQGNTEKNDNTTGNANDGSNKKRKNSNGDSSVSAKKKGTTARGSPRKAAARGDEEGSAPVTPTRTSRIAKPNAVMSEKSTLPVARDESAGVNPKSEVAAAFDRVPGNIVIKSSETTDGTSTSRDKSNFKSLAQAAVSTLISASKAEEPAPKGEVAFTGKIDTSTAHVKALTGNNWVTASASVSVSVPPVTTSPVLCNSNDAKANAERARARQTLTADDRAKQNRDRNREHARNTRLRKKAYVDELKRTLIEIVNQRDASEAQKKQAAQRDLEQREVRFRVSEEFLKLRGRNESNSSRWAAILDDDFNLTLPVTRYREMVSDDCASGQQQLVGVAAIMADASRLAEFLNGLNENSSDVVTLQYRCDRKDFFMDGCFAVLEWEATPSVGGEPVSDAFKVKCFNL